MYITRRLPDRTAFASAGDTVKYIWNDVLNLPSSALNSLSLPEPTAYSLHFRSSFKIDHLAQSTIGLSALAASLIHAFRHRSSHAPAVSVSSRHAALAFLSERLYLLNGHQPAESWGDIGGLYRTKKGTDGYGFVRIHASFDCHRTAALRVLQFPEDAIKSGALGKQDVEREIASWDAAELEQRAHEQGAVMVMLRDYDQWDALPQAQSTSDLPLAVTKLWGDDSSGRQTVDEPQSISMSNFAKRGQEIGPSADDRPLRGLRVLELSRVIAAPVAGKTLAAHGADVLWLTAQHLETLPALDADLSRGKRTIQLDYRQEMDRTRILELVRDADVFIQGYRPGSLEKYGLGVEDLRAINPAIIYASLSAYGGPRDGTGPDESPGGPAATVSPWSQRRGFDSQVQTCSGMNVSEAKHFSAADQDPLSAVPARPMPCQALDHGAGYLLATGIMAAVYKRDFSPHGHGSYKVDISLVGVMRYLRSLGQYPGAAGFECSDPVPASATRCAGDDVEQYFEIRKCGFGDLRAVKHPAVIQGCSTGWTGDMPKQLGSDKAEWI